MSILLGLFGSALLSWFLLIYLERFDEMVIFIVLIIVCHFIGYDHSLTGGAMLGALPFTMYDIWRRTQEI